MHEGGGIVVHIQEFDQISTDLLNLGVKMDEKDKSLLLLCLLLFSYDLLVTTLLYSKETLYYGVIVLVLRSNK